MLPGYPGALLVKPMSMETMRFLVGVTSKAPGYPGSILGLRVDKSLLSTRVGLIIVAQRTMRTARVSQKRWTRLSLKLRAKQSRNKCIVTKALWTELRSE